MKKKFMKKALAVVLSTAMTFSLSSAAEMKTASAAANFVGLKTTFKTLKVGQTYRLTLKNNNINWKIKKVTTSDKTIATVYGKTASYVMLKGKSEGRAKIRVSLTTAARKTNNTKNLRCTVNVVPAAVDPGQTTPTNPGNQDPVQTTATVATQAELDAALNNSAITSITIQTSAAETFTIPSGQYRNVDVIVDAPNAAVVNSAVFKTVTIKAIKDSTWTEKANGNSLRVDASKARIVVDEGANVAGITVATANADIAIVVDGTLGGVTVNAKAKVAISGKTTTKVPVTLSAGAANAELISSAPVDVKAAASANVELQAGAEESAVQVTSNTATVVLKNNTTKTITVTKADNTTSNVFAGGTLTASPSSQTTTPVTTPTTSGGSWWGGSSSSGSTVTSRVVATQADLNAALDSNSISEITIKTDATTKFIIGTENGSEWRNNYLGKALIINAPNATIENYGNFKSIEIQDIADHTWFEYATRNRLTVLAPTPHIVVGKKGRLQGLTFGGTVKTAKLDVADEAAIESDVVCAAASSDAILRMNVTSSAEKAIVGAVKLSTVMSLELGGNANAASKISVEVSVANETKSK